MSARKVTPQVRNLMDDPAYSTCIANLRAAGYVILSPDELRGIRDDALEEAAVKAFQVSQHVRANADDVAAAIRSLKGGRDAN